MKLKLFVLSVFVSIQTTTLALELKSIDKNVLLFIGDSHSYGRFGTTLEESLSKIFLKASFMSSCGSTPNTWLGKSGNENTVCGFWKKEGTEIIRTTKFKNPNLSTELLRLRPNLTIVQLGTNIAAAKSVLNSRESIVKVMRTIKEEASECIWIGPPDAHSKIVTLEKLKMTNELLKKISKEEGCHYIDSLQLTSFPKNNKEGIHYPAQLSGSWGLKVLGKIEELLSLE